MQYFLLERKRIYSDDKGYPIYDVIGITTDEAYATVWGHKNERNIVTEYSDYSVDPEYEDKLS